MNMTPRLFKTGIELSDLCLTTIQSLIGADWEINRQLNFSLFCNQLLTQINIPPPVVYTSLKYFQNIILASNNELINTHEYSLFTVSLLLAYKFLEDNPPFMSQWSYVSLIPITELQILELQALKILDFSLNISVNEFYQWTEQCNTFCDMPYLLFDDQLITSSTSSSIQTSPVLTPDYYNSLLLPLPLIDLSCQNDYLLDPSLLSSQEWIQQIDYSGHCNLTTMPSAAVAADTSFFK